MLTQCNPDSPQDRARYVLEMHAVMAWPKQPSKRSAFLCWAGAALAEMHAAAMEAAKVEVETREEERWQALWEQVYSDNGGRRGLMEAPAGDQILAEYEQKIRDALLAGRVLNFCIQLHKTNGLSGNASLRKAKELVYRHVPDDVAKMFNLPRSHRPVDEAWASHRSVAHLAAAFMSSRALAMDALANGRADGGIRFGVFLERHELITVLRLAVTAYHVASEIIPHGQSSPILSASEIVGTFPTITPFTDDEVEFVPLAESVASSLQKTGRR